MSRDRPTVRNKITDGFEYSVAFVFGEYTKWPEHGPCNARTVRRWRR